jgi:hypothetical protein
MTRNPIFITGCQRSGTNLLNLILDSHPQIQGVDELNLFHWEVIAPVAADQEPSEITVEDSAKVVMVDDRIAVHLANPDYPPYVAFQLPPYASKIAFLKSLLPQLQILWCLRDPRDVVASMLKLRLPYKRSRVNPDGSLQDAPTVSWPVHSAAMVEINHALHYIDQPVRQALSGYLATYDAIRQKSPPLRTHDDAVFMDALCWRLKNELLQVYDREQLPYLVLRYEQIVSDPRRQIEKVLAYLGVPWHEDVLRHHELHSGMVIGETDSGRAIDANNTGKWQGSLSEAEVEVIGEITSDLAIRLGYVL